MIYAFMPLSAWEVSTTARRSKTLVSLHNAQIFRLLRRDFYRTRKQIDQQIKMTPTVNLYDNGLCRPSFFPEGTLIIKTWGPGSARATHVVMQRPLGALSGALSSTLQVWRQEDPYRWYTTAKRDRSQSPFFPALKSSGARQQERLSTGSHRPLSMRD